MMTSRKYWLSGLLVLSSVLLSTLIPGGPIETRSFAHIDPIILGSFNIFLTSLNIGSLLLAYFVWQEQRWSFLASAIFGLSYFFTYTLDLGGLFPISPDAMPLALFSIEIAGTAIALPLTIAAAQAMQDSIQTPIDGRNAIAIDSTATVKWSILMLILAVLAVAIVIFATRSAMAL
ncbi:MAG: hypothetical protein J7647_30060 [Cyanobacteria bacterium SBLK]|nr:hypothetical protein [Cyanobacteria bacterium SBLK]